MKLLFIGNSATHVHDIPKLLSSLAADAGIFIETEMLTADGCDLYTHADASSEHGKKVLEKIREGFDIVFLQEHGNCIASPEKAERSLDAMRRLAKAVKDSGAELYYYVRPPYGIKNSGYDSLLQSELFDRHFIKSQKETGAKCVFVNRAFAYAIKNSDFRLFGPDNAHASRHGAHLIAATFFATPFGKSASVLKSTAIPQSDALRLAEIADKIVFS